MATSLGIHTWDMWAGWKEQKTISNQPKDTLLLFSVLLWQLAEYSWHWETQHNKIYITIVCYSTMVRHFTAIHVELETWLCYRLICLVFYNIYGCSELPQCLKQARTWKGSSRNWKLMQCACEHLGVHKAVLNALCNIIDTNDTIKKEQMSGGLPKHGQCLLGTNSESCSWVSFL